MYIKDYGKDSHGWFAWIKLGTFSGLTINFGLKMISLGASLDVSWNEDCRYIALNLFNLDITYFPKVDWD